MDQKRIALITGATAGIGRHAALYLAARGFRVIATGRNADALAELGVEAEGDLTPLRLDVTDQASIDSAVEVIDRITGGHGVDVLVNNAGYGDIAPMETTTDKDLRAVFDTNVFGLMAVTRAFLPRMRERGAGRMRERQQSWRTVHPPAVRRLQRHQARSRVDVRRAPHRAAPVRHRGVARRARPNPDQVQHDLAEERRPLRRWVAVCPGPRALCRAHAPHRSHGARSVRHVARHSPRGGLEVAAVAVQAHLVQPDRGRVPARHSDSLADALLRRVLHLTPKHLVAASSASKASRELTSSRAA